MDFKSLHFQSVACPRMRTLVLQTMDFQSIVVDYLIYGMASKDHKAAYQPGDDRVSLLTIHSSKGLEFSRVIMVGDYGGWGHIKDDEEQLSQEVRLLYVGMTRAMECLLVTTSEKNKFSRKLSAAAVQ